MELVPAARRELLRAGGHPSQQLVLSYQSDLLERPLDEVVRSHDEGLSRLRRACTPYIALHANPVDPAERAWLADRLPQAEIVVRPVGHHFPHLADPARLDTSEVRAGPQRTGADCRERRTARVARPGRSRTASHREAKEAWGSHCPRLSSSRREIRERARTRPPIPMIRRPGPVRVAR